MCVKNMHCFGGRGVLENLREQRTRSRLAAAALRDCCGENWSWHLGLCHCARPGVDGPALCYAHSQPTLPPPYSLHLTALLKYIKDVVQRRILIAQALSPHTTPPPPPPTLDFVQAAFNCISWTAAAANIPFVASASCTLAIAMSK